MRELGAGHPVACHFPLPRPARPAARVAAQTERS